MNTTTNLLLVPLSLVLTGCFGLSYAPPGCGDGGRDACGSGEIDAPTSPPPVVIEEPVASTPEFVTEDIEVLTASGDVVGAVIGFTLSFVNLYIVEDALHITVDPVSGEYLAQPISPEYEIYFEDLDCTGDAVTLKWTGEVGGTYIEAKNGLSYLVDSTTNYTINNRFSALSRLVANRPSDDSCSNSNASITQFGANLIEVSSLDDLSSYAPLQLYGGE